MLRNFLKSFLLSLLLLAGGAFTAADLPFKGGFTLNRLFCAAGQKQQ